MHKSHVRHERARRSGNPLKARSGIASSSTFARAPEGCENSFFYRKTPIAAVERLDSGQSLFFHWIHRLPMNTMSLSSFLHYQVARLLPGVLALTTGMAHAQSAPEVVSFTPQGESRRIQQVAVRFGADMVRLGEADAPAPISVSCKGAGTEPPKGRWIDARRFAYEWPRDVPIGTSCTSTLRDGLKTLDGRGFSGIAPWEFTTGGAKIAQTLPGAGHNRVKERGVFLLRLDAPVDQASIAKHLQCQVEGAAAQPMLALGREAGIEAMRDYSPQFPEREWESQRWQAWACTQALPNDAKVRLVWGAGISTNGVSSKADQVLAYSVRPAFKLTVTCGVLDGVSGCDPRNGVRMDFTAEVDTSEAAKVQLTAPDGSAIGLNLPSPRGNSARAYEAPLTLSTNPFPASAQDGGMATVSLRGDLRDRDGRALANSADFPRRIAVAKLPPYLGFVQTSGVLPATSETGKPAHLTVAARYVETALTAKAIRIGGEGGTTAETTALELFRTHESWQRNNPTASDAPYPLTQALGTRLPAPVDLGLTTSGARTEFVGLPLTRPGLWWVELDSPTFRATRSATQRSALQRGTLVQVTDLNVSVRAGQDGLCRKGSSRKSRRSAGNPRGHHAGQS